MRIATRARRGRAGRATARRTAPPRGANSRSVESARGWQCPL